MINSVHVFNITRSPYFFVFATSNALNDICFTYEIFSTIINTALVCRVWTDRYLENGNLPGM